MVHAIVIVGIAGRVHGAIGKKQYVINEVTQLVHGILLIGVTEITK